MFPFSLLQYTVQFPLLNGSTEATLGRMWLQNSDG